MRVAVVYVYPNLQHEKYVPAATLFVESYLEFPPGKEPHDLYVMITGYKPTDLALKLFEPLPVIFHEADNYAKDLGAFKRAAQIIDADLLVCLGAHVNFKRGGWLDRILWVLNKTGPTLCGPWAFQEPKPHLRTTFFCCPPTLLKEYPHDLRERYQFEHGRDNFSIWSKAVGMEPWQITWTQVYAMNQWAPVSLHESLARDQHTLRDFGE